MLLNTFSVQGFVEGSLRILMNSLMVGEVRVLAEGLLTLCTFVRFLARVDSLVLNEGRVEPKGFPALFTVVGLLTRVNALMLRKL